MKKDKRKPTIKKIPGRSEDFVFKEPMYVPNSQPPTPDLMELPKNATDQLNAKDKKFQIVHLILNHEN